MKIISILAVIFALAIPASATITCAEGGPNCTSTTVRSCTASSGTSCSITVGSTTAHAVEAMCVNLSSEGFTATASTSDGTWHVATSSLNNGTYGSTECEYNLNATGGATSITCDWSGSTTADCEWFEFTYTESTITFDTSNNTTDAACTTCTAVALTLSTSNNYILIQSATTQETVTALSQSYNIAVNSTTGNGAAYKLASSAGTTPSWTNSASGKLSGGAMGIYESSSTTFVPQVGAFLPGP